LQHSTLGNDQIVSDNSNCVLELGQYQSKARIRFPFSIDR